MDINIKSKIEELRKQGYTYYEISQELGISQDAIRNYFYRERRKNDVVEETEKFVIRIPESIICQQEPKEYVPSGNEEAVLQLSDIHYGALIESQIATYNEEIATARLTYLTDRVIGILKTFHPTVKKIHILFEGDIIDGENMYPDQQYYSITISRQLENVVAPLSYLLSQFVQHFAVECYAVSGNHARTSRNSRPSDSYDHVVYTTMARLFPQLSWHISDDWWQKIKILNTTLLLMHGDDITNSSEPEALVERAALRYRKMMGDFDYLTIGHFHHHWETDNVIANGNVCGATFFSQRRIMVATPPSQNLFLISPKHHKTLIRQLMLDEQNG